MRHIFEVQVWFRAASDGESIARTGVAAVVLLQIPPLLIAGMRCACAVRHAGAHVQLRHDATGADPNAGAGQGAFGRCLFRGCTQLSQDTQVLHV